MRCLQLEPSATISFSSTAPYPTPSPTQVLIRVHATAITANELTWTETTKRPLAVPGHDVSGTVVAVPAEGSTELHIGDTVFALISFSRDGAAAEFVLAEPYELAPKPRTLNHSQAAAVPLSTLTAWQALFVHASLEAGQSVLVLGAAGGVGTMAVQLARWKGARVVGTCSGGKAGLVEGLGASEVVDYTKNKVEGRFHIVLDCVGGDTQEGGWKCIAEGGIIVSVAEPLKEESKKRFPGLRSSYFVVKSNGDQLSTIGRLIEEGKIKPVVDQIFPLEEGAAAFELLAKGRSTGKIVLQVLG